MPDRMPDDKATLPWWKANASYRALRRARAAVRSHVEGRQLQRRFEQGFRLVPERELEACLRGAVQRLQQTGAGEPRGDYLEFGVCHGSSMACMHRAARACGLTDLRLIGFDSFAGLPQEASLPGEGPWHPGQYRSDISFTRRVLNEAGVDWGRTILVKGWFADTLTAATMAQYSIRHASIVMIDVDIYSSARQALQFCAPLIHDRAVLLFDDWNSGDLAARGGGEKRAFDEFLAANKDLSVERLTSYSPNAEVFMVERSVRH
jgi:O-methyltransferase